MNTFLSKEDQSQKETFDSFVRQNIYPVAKSLDLQSGALPDILLELGRRGYLGLTVPKEFGGQGEAFLHLAFLVEAISQCAAGLALTIAVHTAAIELLLKYGDDRQKARYLPLLASGQMLAGFAIAEESADVDFESVVCEAVNGAGGLILSGKKVWVTNGELAGILIVLAAVKESAESNAGTLRLLIVDMNDKEKISLSGNKSKLGLRSAYTNDVEFSQLIVPEDCVLGASGSGAAMGGTVGSAGTAGSASLDSQTAVEQALFGMDVSKALIAASAVGLAQRALGEAVEHARNSQQFDKNMQAIQWKLADGSVELEAARLQTYRAAWSKDNSPGEFRKNAAMCKWYAARVARFHSSELMQVLGADAVNDDSIMEQLYRDAKMMELVEGTSEFQKLLLVRELDI